MSMFIGLVMHVAATNITSVAATIGLGAPEKSEMIRLNWVGDSSSTYTIKKSVDLSGNSWSNLAENVPGVDGVMTVSNELSGSQAFYQVMMSSNAVPDVDATPPTASIISPADQDTVSGTISVDAIASDASGINKVGLYVDDGWVETDHGDPFQFDVDTTALSNGSHLIKVRAVDQADNGAFSSSITVIVANDSEPGRGSYPSDGFN